MGLGYNHDNNLSPNHVILFLLTVEPIGPTEAI